MFGNLLCFEPHTEAKTMFLVSVYLGIVIQLVVETFIDSYYTKNILWLVLKADCSSYNIRWQAEYCTYVTRAFKLT